MKQLLGMILMLGISYSTIGQDEDKTAYVGFNIGTSYLLNGRSNAGNIGANLNLINFGYSFKNKLGISFKWMGAAHQITDDYRIGYGSIMVGPMYSINLSKELLLDLKIQSGLFWTVEEIKFIAIDNSDPNLSGGAGKFSTIGLKSFAAGAALRHNFAKRWNWMFLAELNYGRAPGFFVKRDRIYAISSNLGIGFRI